MGFNDKALALGKKFKLDSHHAIERFGVLFGVVAFSGLVVIAGSAASALTAGRGEMTERSLYTTQFETSKTHLGGNVDGVYVNEDRDKALVMMHFEEGSAISYSAADYQAFLLGSTTDLGSEPVKTRGITGSFHVFGSTGYLGVVLDAEEPFEQQVLDLTVRSNSELAFDEQTQVGGTQAETAGAEDPTFDQYDQWRIFVNPGATGAAHIPALDTLSFDPARAYYDVVLNEEEKAARDALDTKLVEMRSNLSRVEAYTADLHATKADGLYLRPPSVPAPVAGDEVTGISASEAEDGVSTLALDTGYVFPGGFDLNWRAGDVYEGYLDALVPPGRTTAEFLSEKSHETSDDAGQSGSDMQWLLSDGSSLTEDYQSSDVTLRPLINVMNNLSQAYQDYASNKAEYQSDLMLDLLRLDVDLRDVEANSSVRDDEKVLAILY